LGILHLELELGFVYVESAAAALFTWARPKALSEKLWYLQQILVRLQ
jgi:hypothetical protein